MASPNPPSAKQDPPTHHHHHHHGPGADEDEQKALLDALTGSSDKGSRVTLLGLAANIALTAVKGIAGYLLASASLIADAGHSLSDLLGDLITLFAWNWSRKPADRDYPFGHGKFESVGSSIVAFFLISGGFGIGLHSYTLILPILSRQLPGLASYLPNFTSDHAHDHEVDIRASYFAFLSIIVKETLYRITYQVGKAEDSKVLIANALHHRSDAFSSFVALLAIVGSWYGLTILDPIGGFIVCSMILRSGLAIGKSSIEELLDKRTDVYLNRDVENVLLSNLEKLQQDKFTLTVQQVKHLKIGPKALVFLELGLAPPANSHQSAAADGLHFTDWVVIQHMLSGLILKEIKNVKDVYIQFKII
ncbi:hypothetical protein PTTG_08391 [Puccinia triticina 1-1 BBBD Race 1]|uniref:Cation efflux protein transmembrane domain-containing protein n=2 Tax=Puccinia triticina TaxID=208348 RepID=A0A180GBM7_PUCT1|nr:uncharacterized protein PtA15_14A398 [Puccinia triticina]OAV89939.1 hypothetical protein PTTG_08391 [Puccinia triticina 1-1 BBBD Race 1]WAQ91514.1 hypothetical protein PtA15_14A398 [Puccinia triticina]